MHSSLEQRRCSAFFLKPCVCYTPTRFSCWPLAPSHFMHSSSVWRLAARPASTTYMTTWRDTSSWKSVQRKRTRKRNGFSIKSMVLVLKLLMAVWNLWEQVQSLVLLRKTSKVAANSYLPSSNSLSISRARKVKRRTKFQMLSQLSCLLLHHKMIKLKRKSRVRENWLTNSLLINRMTKKVELSLKLYLVLVPHLLQRKRATTSSVNLKRRK